MTIPPPVSQREFDQSQSYLALSTLVRIFEEASKVDLEHKQNLLWRLFQTTETAADPKQVFYEEYRKIYLNALGDDADPFLTAFNATVSKYVAAVRAGVRDPAFEYAGPEDKKHILDGLRKLKEKTTSHPGFYVPYPGMNHPRQNTHLCTGH